MGLFDFKFDFNPFSGFNSWGGGRSGCNDDDDSCGSKFVVGGHSGGKFINHCGGNTWMDTDGHLNVRTGSNTWMDMDDGDIFFG